jgi:GT2 family glycosyltransferase
MSITVIIPTYSRSKDLERCFGALTRQKRPADEIVIVVRESDAETWTFLDRIIYPLPLKIVTVCVPGVVAAMNAALKVSQEDIVVFTDDDAAPHEDWLQRIEAYFLSDTNKLIGGVGGRDYIYLNGELWQGEKGSVGKLLPFGKVIGNHHLGTGISREVDILKGVNMSFRREAIQDQFFDSRMLGSGAQVHFEVEFCLRLRKLGWKLIYDPSIAVDHFCAQRFDEDQRNQFNEVALFNEIHNETLALLGYLPTQRRILFYVWAILIGHRRALGLLQLLRFLPNEGTLAFKKWFIAIKGRSAGWSTWCKTGQDTGVIAKIETVSGLDQQ